jgi:hypothetical protein
MTCAPVRASEPAAIRSSSVGTTNFGIRFDASVLNRASVSATPALLSRQKSSST